MTINDEIAYALLAYRADEWSLAEALSRIRDTLHPAPEPAKPTPAKVNGSRKTGKGKASGAASTRATKAIAMEVGTRHGVSAPSALKKALTSEGYNLPTSPSTVENWCRELRQTVADDQ